MAEALAGLLASALVSTVKNKLSSAIAGQASLLCNFGVDLEDMMDVFETISAVLEDAERRSVKEKLVRLWLKRLKDVGLDISDILEDYEDTCDQTTAKKRGVLSCLPMAYKKIVVANRMKSLREKLTKIRNEMDNFNFMNDSSTTTEQPYDERETTSNLPEEPLIGRGREKQEVIKLLSANTNNDDIVILPIYGLGGMGKSTLAQLVYNDESFKKYDHRIWVYVSQDFNLNNIGSSIISQLPSQGGPQNLGIQQVINQCLQNLLQGKEVLIVLDDLWEEKKTELDKLRRMLHVSGSKVDVIVTTRKEEIARKVSTSEPFKLRPLDYDICWAIIKRCSRFELKSNKEKLEKIGLDIAKKCGGVPLAAQAIGFMLLSIDDLSAWTKINSSETWNGSSEDSDVLPSLKLSYERMPPQLRICFSFCAIFPKGHSIIEDDLVQQWVSLGFIEQSKGKEYFNNLLGMSFLQVSKLHLTSQEHVVLYTMHDLVHDLARLIMTNELIVFDVAPRRNIRAHKYCRYSLLRKYDPTVKLTNMPTKMRALLFSDSSELLNIPSAAFSFAKCLRTLDFSECSGILLPASFGRLKQLRCLIAPRMKNESLPECITELSKLQYLNINGSSQMSALPESIGRLGCLKYLCLSGCSGILKLPESFGDLICMVHLVMSGCAGVRELPDSLGNLTNLQHLELSRCSNLEAIPELLCRLTQLQYLNLSSCARLDRLPEAIGSLMSLQYLNMSSCRQIIELPESMVKLQNLLHLDLSCTGIKYVGVVRDLTALQHLFISHLSEDFSDVLPNLTNLKCLGLNSVYMRSMEGSGSYVPEWIGTLTNLENLDLSSSNGFSSLPESTGNLKRLHTLDLSYCFDLKSLPESIGALGLKSLVLEGCSDELMDQASSLVSYRQTLPVFKVRADGGVNGCSNLHLLDDVHVSELRIHSLENVKSLEEAKKVKLSDKHNLSELRLAWSTRRAVQILEDKELLEQLVPPTGLKSMSVRGYSCTSFPGWLMCISRHLPNLASIHLCEIHTCCNLPPLGQLPHLKTLQLWKLPSIKVINKELCGGKGAFRRLSSFSMTWMDGLEEWNTTYSVEDGVDEFIMFPVLDTLDIAYCPRLRLKPCPPTFRECFIDGSDQVISSLEEVDKTSHHCSSSSRAIKLDLAIQGSSSQSIRLFHHFPTLQDLCISRGYTKIMPESMRHLTSLESLRLQGCNGISALPEWLGDLSSLRSLVILGCKSIKSLPPSIQQLTKLQKIQVKSNPELKKWCESEANKTLAHINSIQLL